MSAVDGGSVPPPGWGDVTPMPQAPLAPEGPAAAVSGNVFISTPQTVSGQPAAEAAVEYRIGAAIIDGLILIGIYGLICVLLGWEFFTLTHQLVALGLNIVYYFLLESRDGQTVGKRSNGIRVVSLDGSPASPKAIAIRSVLRVIDALPVFYASGLINMVRTGPARRQRIGDVAAETKVIAVEGRALTRGTPGWVLPTVTLLALLFSVADVLAIVNARNAPLTSEQQAQFVTNCDAAAHGLLDCQCVLSRLEADGYTTANSINAVAEQSRSEELTNQTGAARTEMTNDVLACRQ
jgi:uncharacterized RDD family membrane protein YckC